MERIEILDVALHLGILVICPLEVTVDFR